MPVCNEPTGGWSGRLEQKRQLSRQFVRRDPREPPEFAGHVRLVGVTDRKGDFDQWYILASYQPKRSPHPRHPPHGPHRETARLREVTLHRALMQVPHRLPREYLLDDGVVAQNAFANQPFDKGVGGVQAWQSRDLTIQAQPAPVHHLKWTEGGASSARCKARRVEVAAWAQADAEELGRSSNVLEVGTGHWTNEARSHFCCGADEDVGAVVGKNPVFNGRTYLKRPVACNVVGARGWVVLVRGCGHAAPC